MAISDQKFSCRTSDGRFGTVTDFDGTSGAALGPARVTYIQVEGVGDGNGSGAGWGAGGRDLGSGGGRVTG